MKKSIYFVIIVFIFGCNQEKPGPNLGSIGTNNTTYQDINVADYQIEDLPGTNWQRAVKRDTANKIVESGFFEKGKKVGAWIQYEHDNKNYPSTLSNYKDGKLNGLHVQFNQGGQIELIAHYQNNNLHGPWSKYRFARILEEANYENGRLNGIFNTYVVATGALQVSAQYKNGVQDGFYRTYNDAGKMTTEYIYKEGAKVSGGVVTRGQ